MTAEDVTKAELESARQKLAVLERQLELSYQQTAEILQILQKHESRLGEHESSIARLDRILMELLTGRIWRTLRAAGEVAKRFMPGSGSSADSLALTAEVSFLKCDEPKPGDRTPRTGSITVRGWCLAEGGADLVNLQVPGLPELEVAPVELRPDVKKMYPKLDHTGRSGFTIEFDSSQLPPGPCTMTLRLISRGVAIRETKRDIVIDHERGFASAYDRWISEFERPDDKLIELKVGVLTQRPSFSIIMAVHNTEPAELDAAIRSVQVQSYSNWQLCIADDASTRPEIREILENAARQDDRIHLVFNTGRGGISNTCNAAWQLATGDFVAFLDHDDALSPHALAYICEALERDPGADFLYSDEDKIDRKGKRYDPFFKPDWSPDLILSENYICHLLVLRKDLADKIGRFDPACDGSQDYDLILRAAEAAKSIQHIPKILYHWRASVGSTATTIENKQYALTAAQEAIRRFCVRSGKPASVVPSNIVGRWRMRYEIPPQTRVSIIIASGGKEPILRSSLRTLTQKTTYKDYEIVVIDNSKADRIQKLVGDFQQPAGRVRYIDWRNKPFNYSVINNAAARHCDSPVLLFLNDDTSVISGDWLEAMVELAMRSEVGVVGAKLLYPDGRIQHGGVVMGLYDNCGHAFKGLEGTARHYFDFSDIIRNVSAVTGACLMSRAEVFWRAGGFDEQEFAVAFNDIDLCLKIGELGYRVLYTPHATLYHHEAFSKTSKDLVPHPEEVAAMRLKWPNVIAQDPFYSPNLTRNDENYSLRTRT
ncbi:MAG TPA: glycosyltransferase family 2 protein [Bryobacteraceae bacterium]|nr:glycosyltransferase family 2 protein [Bryobacteraceae bacterium]